MKKFLFLGLVGTAFSPSFLLGMQKSAFLPRLQSKQKKSVVHMPSSAEHFKLLCDGCKKGNVVLVMLMLQNAVLTRSEQIEQVFGLLYYNIYALKHGLDDFAKNEKSPEQELRDYEHLAAHLKNDYPDEPYPKWEEAQQKLFDAFADDGMYFDDALEEGWQKEREEVMQELTKEAYEKEVAKAAALAKSMSRVPALTPLPTVAKPYR